MRELRIKYLVTETISTEDPSFDVVHKDERGTASFRLGIKERLSPSGDFFPPSEFARFYGTLVLSTNVHSWRINRARPHAFNNDRHAYNRSERRVLPGAVALSCLHCPRIRHVFAPRQTKASGTARENGIAMNAI